MANSKTSICNMAIGHLGVGVEIANVDAPSEKSAEAKACRRFYDTVIREVLRDFDWPFATKTRALALITEDPNSEWGYAYAYPADALYIRKLLSGIRNDDEDSAVVYELGHGDAGTEVLTDQADAEARYTVMVSDVNRYPPDFLVAVSYLLGHYICPRQTGDIDLKSNLRTLYTLQVQKAAGNAKNEQRKDLPPLPDLIRARGGY